MTQQAEIVNRIGKIPAQYLGEVIDFLGYIQHKAQQKASNNEYEQQARDWNTPPSKPKMRIPVNSEGKFILTKEVLEELEKDCPITQSLCGIIPGMSDLTDEELDEIRYKALAEKHLK